MACFIAAGAVGIAGYKELTRSDSIKIKVIKAGESFAEDIIELGDLAKNIFKHKINDRKHQQNIDEEFQNRPYQAPFFDNFIIESSGVQRMDKFKIKMFTKTTAMFISLIFLFKSKSQLMTFLRLFSIYKCIVKLAEDSRLFKGIIAIDLRKTTQDEMDDLQSDVTATLRSGSDLNQTDSNGATPFNCFRNRYGLLDRKVKEIALFEGESLKAVQKRSDLKFNESVEEIQLKNHINGVSKVKALFQIGCKRVQHFLKKDKRSLKPFLRNYHLVIRLNQLNRDIRRLQPVCESLS